jgi:hypothetical protein
MHASAHRDDDRLWVHHHHDRLQHAVQGARSPVVQRVAILSGATCWEQPRART